MKKKIVLLIIALLTLIIALPACDVERDSSIKAITRPYINTYECVEATYGGEDILGKFDYIKIVLMEKDEMEVAFKFKNGEKKKLVGTYSVDDKTNELTTDIGVTGYRFKEKVILEDGGFTVTTILLSKTLFMKFRTA